MKKIHSLEISIQDNDNEILELKRSKKIIDSAGILTFNTFEPEYNIQVK